MDANEKIIYLAGGCFGGMELLMQSIPGVIDVQSGYTNGTEADSANYPTGCTGNTGFQETVWAEYGPNEINLDALLLACSFAIGPRKCLHKIRSKRRAE